jgi:integrase
MASIKRHTRKSRDGKTITYWRAQFVDPNGKQREKRAPTKIEVQAWLDEQTKEIVSGTWRDPEGKRTILRGYALDHVAHLPIRQSTRDQYLANLNGHILPTFGDRQLGSIRPSEVRAWAASLDRAPSTNAGIVRLLRSIFNAAVDDGLVALNPVKQKRPRRDAPPHLVPLTVEQVRTLADAIRPDLRAMVLTAAGSGLRQGELLGLTQDRVRWLQREIVVDRQLVTPNRGTPEFGPPKTQRSNRIVPVAAFVIDLLAAHLEAFGTNGDGLLFHREGERWRRGRMNDAWRDATTKAEIPARFHDLRHHFASLLIASGCSVRAVSDALGHSSAAETLDTYSHLWPNDHDRIRDAIQHAHENGQSMGSSAAGGL